MKKIILVLAGLFMLTASVTLAADVKLDWDVVTGATGYKISMSTDLGKTWAAAVDAGTTKPFIFPNCPDDKLVLFKISAYNTTAGDTWNNWAGAWYDGTKKPLATPMGTGVK